MKQTHVLRGLGDVSAIMAGASTVTEAATTLGVDRSTVTRWIAAGKVPRPGGRREATGSPSTAPALPVSADAWAADVRERYTLSVTENAIVELARSALTLALDSKEGPRVRAAASREFRACVGDLKLEAESDGEAKTPRGASVRAFPRPA